MERLETDMQQQMKQQDRFRALTCCVKIATVRRRENSKVREMKTCRQKFTMKSLENRPHTTQLPLPKV